MKVIQAEREYYEIYFLSKLRNPPLIIDVTFDNCKVRMEVDTCICMHF